MTSKLKNKKNIKVNCQLSIVSCRSGQSLIEILIALAIGAILIGAASLGIAFMLRSTSTSQSLQSAGGLIRETVEKLRAWSSADWQNVYGLDKGLSTKYFLNASGTTFSAVEGQEGILEGEVRGDLSGRWGFDEATGTTAYDMSGGNQHGSFSGTPSRVTSTCKLGNCLSFGGTSGVLVPDATSTDPTSAWTVSAWIYRTATGSVHSIVEKYDNAIGKGNFALRLTSDNLFIAYVYDGASVNDCGTTETQISINTWYHVAAAFDSSANTLVCYVNGTEEASNASATVNPPASDLTLKIACKGDDCSQKFPGTMDDVRLYSRALSAAEVKRLGQSRMFTRYFSIENTCRSSTASTTINTSPCGGDYFNDPSTQKVTAVVKWPTTQTIAEFRLVEFLTRWKNEVFRQQDWSGGSGQEGPIAVPNTRFASSTSIDVSSSGIIKIQGL